MYYNDDPIFKKLFPYNIMPNAESFCYNILTYLLDLPKDDYTPSDEGARADLARLLWYDDPDALNRAKHLPPTPSEKVSMIYKPDIPTPTAVQAPQGYRLYLQQRVSEAQLDQKTELRVFPGYTDPTTDFTTKQGVHFQILCGMSINPLEGGMNRAYCIALCILRALNGVDIGCSTGVLHFSRQFYRSCSIEPFTDARYNLGYNLTMAAEFSASEGDAICQN